jgi:hypothetical protein
MKRFSHLLHLSAVCREWEATVSPLIAIEEVARL